MIMKEIIVITVIMAKHSHHTKIISINRRN